MASGSRYNNCLLDACASCLFNLKGVAMPYVNVRLAGSLTREQKQKIAEEITDTLERIAQKPRSYTYITFDEVKEENWAVAGELLDQS
jgi:4-oxalocrotonate tautomerase